MNAGFEYVRGPASLALMQYTWRVNESGLKNELTWEENKIMEAKRIF